MVKRLIARAMTGTFCPHEAAEPSRTLDGEEVERSAGIVAERGHDEIGDRFRIPSGWRQLYLRESSHCIGPDGAHGSCILVRV